MVRPWEIIGILRKAEASQADQLIPKVQSRNIRICLTDEESL